VIKTLLVDGDNLFKIGFHGVRELFVEGNHIGGVFHFLNTLRRQLVDNEYDKVIVFWDGKQNSKYRREIYPNYKLNRKNDMTEEKLESYHTQKDRVKQYLEECFVRQIEVDENESDDLIAFYCQMATDENKVIFSSDKDLLQLINETTSLYSPLQRYTYRMGDKVKFGDYYIPHQNILTVKIFMGDNSDNIQGIVRLGEKTFVKFFPEVLETTLNVDDILTRTKSLIKENNKLNVLKNIVNGQTKDGEFGDKFYSINQRIMDLSNPMITVEGQEVVTLYYSESLDPEGRDRKNIISMMMNDGFFKYLPKNDEAFVEFLKPFLKLTRKEKRKFNQSNQNQL
jgi:5'-3' exonuclease